MSDTAGQAKQALNGTSAGAQSTLNSAQTKVRTLCWPWPVYCGAAGATWPTRGLAATCPAAQACGPGCAGVQVDEVLQKPAGKSYQAHAVDSAQPYVNEAKKQVRVRSPAQALLG